MTQSRETHLKSLHTQPHCKLAAFSRCQVDVGHLPAGGQRRADATIFYGVRYLLEALLRLRREVYDSFFHLSQIV